MAPTRAIDGKKEKEKEKSQAMPQKTARELWFLKCQEKLDVDTKTAASAATKRSLFIRHSSYGLFLTSIAFIR
jgi:hypothetical protein